LHCGEAELGKIGQTENGVPLSPYKNNIQLLMGEFRGNKM